MQSNKYPVTEIPTPSEFRIITTMHYLPSLRYLRKGRMILASIYVAFFYALYFFFALDIIYTFSISQGSIYPDDIYVIVLTLFIVASAGPLLQLRRLMLALSTKRRALNDGITIPRYETDLTPIEAAVLLDVQSKSHISYVILNELQQKGHLNAWQHNGKIEIEKRDSMEVTKPYENVYMAYLLNGSTHASLTPYQLKHHKALKLAEKTIYQDMKQQGYLGKMDWFQEMVYSYLFVTSMVLSYLLLPLLLLFMIVPILSTIAHIPQEVMTDVSKEQLWLAWIGLAVLAIAPAVLYLQGAYTKKGSEKFREAVGLYWFLRTAYGKRLKHQSTLSSEDATRYLPYAEAFGLAKLTK